jgi:hypothetical protein
MIFLDRGASTSLLHLGEKHYDIVFDFSSSPQGGSLKRIAAYVNYFSNSPIKTLFLLQPAVADQLGSKEGVDIVKVRKNKFLRALGISEYLNFLKVKPTWLFSYGIPIYHAVAQHHWFHISNTLPLALGSLPRSSINYYRQAVLQRQLRKHSPLCDVVSAESEFALTLYETINLGHPQQVVLKNGISPGALDFTNAVQASPKYAIAVGTSDHKRIALTGAVYDALKSQLGLSKLVIIGQPSEVPADLLQRMDIELLRPMSEGQYWPLLAKASAFISSAVIENSSNAVLEALTLCPLVILSDIPSHQEMVVDVDKTAFMVLGQPHFMVNNHPSGLTAPTWSDSIAVMLGKMGLPGN